MFSDANSSLRENRQDSAKLRSPEGLRELNYVLLFLLHVHGTSFPVSNHVLNEMDLHADGITWRHNSRVVRDRFRIFMINKIPISTRSAQAVEISNHPWWNASPWTHLSTIGIWLYPWWPSRGGRNVTRTSHKLQTSSITRHRQWPARGSFKVTDKDRHNTFAVLGFIVIDSHIKLPGRAR